MITIMSTPGKEMIGRIFNDCDVLGGAAASDARMSAGGALNMPTKSQRIFIYRPTIR
jgi:hypothetical protein